MGPRSGSTKEGKVDLAERGRVLVIVRHGHRSKAMGKERDNGLSKKGKRQAAKISEHFRRIFPGESPLVLSSAKARCVETVELLAKATGTKVKISPLLMEQGGVAGEGERAETDREFAARTAEFVRWWREDAPLLTVACSHGDWIPMALKALTGAFVELKKGGWAEIDVPEGEPRLVWLIQSFDEEGE